MMDCFDAAQSQLAWTILESRMDSATFLGNFKQDLEERLGSKVHIVSYRPTMNPFLKRRIVLNANNVVDAALTSMMRSQDV